MKYITIPILLVIVLGFPLVAPEAAAIDWERIREAAGVLLFAGVVRAFV